MNRRAAAFSLIFLLFAACKRPPPPPPYHPTTSVGTDTPDLTSNLPARPTITLIFYGGGGLDGRKKVEAALTLHGHGSKDTLPVLMTEVDPLTDGYPSLKISPASDLSDGWYDLNLGVALDPGASDDDPAYIKQDGLPAIRLRVGSGPVLRSVANCSGETPLLLFEFSEPVKLPAGVDPPQAVHLSQNGSPISCAFTEASHVPWQWACGDVHGAIEVTIDSLQAVASEKAVSLFSGQPLTGVILDLDAAVVGGNCPTLKL